MTTTIPKGSRVVSLRPFERYDIWPSNVEDENIVWTHMKVWGEEILALEIGDLM
jgi:hypothetical protein